MCVLVVLAVFCFVSGAEWYEQAFFVGMMALLLGTYPAVRFAHGRLERQMFVAFLPMRTQRWTIERFVAIDVEHDDKSWGIWAFWFFYYWVLSWLVDTVIPWFSGRYRLFLRGKGGKRVLVWQGNADRHFDGNLNLLVRMTGLSVNRK
jgi:hypothetical protein